MKTLYIEARFEKCSYSMVSNYQLWFYCPQPSDALTTLQLTRCFISFFFQYLGLNMALFVTRSYNLYIEVSKHQAYKIVFSLFVQWPSFRIINLYHHYTKFQQSTFLSQNVSHLLYSIQFGIIQNKKENLSMLYPECHWVYIYIYIYLT